MKTTTRLASGVLFGVCVLWAILPGAKADEWQEWREAQDRACREAQAEREAQDRAYREAQAEQAARDRYYYEQQQQREAQERYYYEQQQQREAQERYYYEQQQQRAAEERAQADREASDKYWRDVQADRDAADKAYWEAQKAQAERDAWYKSQEESRQFWESVRQQEEYDKSWQNYWGTEDWSAPTGQIWFQGHRAWQSVVILNSFVLKQKTPEEQDKVRKEATEMGQHIMPEGPAQPQLIENPFVRPK